MFPVSVREGQKKCRKEGLSAECLIRPAAGSGTGRERAQRLWIEPGREERDVAEKEMRGSRGKSQMAEREERRRRFWSRTPVLVLMAFISCFLWGSAFPCIKIGYRLFAIAAGDAASQIFFAGIRFSLAGVMVILIASLQQGRFAAPARQNLSRVLLLCFLQTVGQYFFFYIGLAHASGVSSSLIEGANTFFCILVAALIFQTEKLTAKKILGCVVGFAGVALIEIPLPGSGQSAGFGFSLPGEGFVLISTVLAAFSSSYIKTMSKRENPMVLSGWQFLFGGLIMALGGYAAGGRIALLPADGRAGAGAAGLLLLSYMAFISACAYTLWSILLKYNPVSRVSVFGFINPVIGVLLSGLLLDEGGQAFSVVGIASLLLVSAGIILVNKSVETRERAVRSDSVR